MHEATGPADPIFHLRRPGGGAGHVWRLFATKREATEWMDEAYGADSEARRVGARVVERRLRDAAQAARRLMPSAAGADLLEHRQDVAAELRGVLAHGEVADLSA